MRRKFCAAISVYKKLSQLSFRHTKQQARPFSGRALDYHLILWLGRTPVLFRGKRRVSSDRGVFSDQSSGLICPRQILLHLVIHRLLDRPDGIKEHPIFCFTVTSSDGCFLRINQSFSLQRMYVFSYCVGAHSCALPNSLIAGPALVSVPVLTEHEIGIHRDFPWA